MPFKNDTILSRYINAILMLQEEINIKSAIAPTILVLLSKSINCTKVITKVEHLNTDE